MTHAEKVKLVGLAQKMINELSESSDALMESGDYENAQKDNHKAQGMLKLTKALVNEMENM